MTPVDDIGAKLRGLTAEAKRASKAEEERNRLSVMATLDAVMEATEWVDRCAAAAGSGKTSFVFDVSWSEPLPGALYILADWLEARGVELDWIEVVGPRTYQIKVDWSERSND